MSMPIGAGVTRDAFVTHVRCATAPAFLLTMVLLQGCATVGPNYVPPHGLRSQAMEHGDAGWSGREACGREDAGAMVDDVQ